VSFVQPLRSRAVRLALGLACAVPVDAALRTPVLSASHPGTLQEPNVVKGTVRTAGGRPVAGATIRIAGATGAARGTSITAKTDRNGNYRVRVPLGHYGVDGFADIEYDGQTYRELWLHRVNGGCERVMSDKGIVRDFVLRLNGLKRCITNDDPNNPGSYYGAYMTAMTSEFPGDAVITFTLTPIGPLADGSTGKRITFTRTGAALTRGGGPIGETAFLHDIPLGRYRLASEVRYANGVRRALTLDSRSDDDPEGTEIEVDFPAAVLGGGFRSVQLALSVDGRAPRPDPVGPATPGRPTPSDAGSARSFLPSGRYACSYRSQYAGDIPTEAAVIITPDGRYQAYGGSGDYAVDERTGAVRWTSGPLARSDTRATFSRRDGRPTITVVGSAASDAPDRTHTCALSGG
jgi:hypothetical protein